MPTMDSVVQGYTRLRDAKKRLQEEHKEQLKPYNERMQKMEAWMLRQLQEQGETAASTAHGTAYQSTVVKPVVVNADEFLNFLRENNLIHLLDVRASKQGIEEYVEATGDTPPGIKITQETFVRVRK